MLYDLKEANNKTVETYTRVVSEPGSSNKKDQNKLDKTQDRQTLLGNGSNYTPLEDPMARATFQKVKKIVEELHQGSFIDEMTDKQLSQTPNPPRIPVFYSLTKIHKLTPVGRPIGAGND